MKYTCIILDHDDTVVNSTATVHFPCFVEYLRLYFPEVYAHGYTLNEYFLKNFDPGMMSLLRDEVGLNEAQLKEEYEFWNAYSAKHFPKAYDGLKEILWEFHDAGGILCVSSHSVRENILRDYRLNELPEPGMVFGWDCPDDQRKPSVYGPEQIAAHYGLRKEEMLMVDDLKPGYDMAQRFGMDFAAAGWAYDIPQIEAFMRKNCDRYFKTVQEFGDFLRE